MARVKNHTKVKEPIRLRMKPLSDGSKSLYLDIYRDGKRTYEYLKMYIIPETDNNARRQNQATMDAANAIKSKRIIELTSNEAGIVFRKDKTFSVGLDEGLHGSPRECGQERRQPNQDCHAHTERLCRRNGHTGSD